MTDNLKILYLTADSSLYGSNWSLLNLLSSINLQRENYLVVTPKYGDLNKELDKRRIRNVVIKYLWDAGFKGNEDIISKSKFFYRYMEKVLVNIKAERKIAALVKENQINLIHTNNSVISVGFAVAKKRRIKHVWHIREFIQLDHELYLYRGEKRHSKKLQQSDSIICVSNALARHFGLKDKAEVIYNAVAKKSEIAEPVEKEGYFLFCGALSRNKGLHKALIAFSEIATVNKNITLKIAGNFVKQDEYVVYIQELVEKLDLSARVEFLGHRKDVKSLMNKAFGLLVCSKSEAMGRVTAEAMLCNCLVIGFNDGAGTSELITHKKTGLLFDTDEEFVLALQFTLEQKPAVAEMIKQAKEYALQNFTEEVLRSRLLQVYENLTH